MNTEYTSAELIDCLGYCNQTCYRISYLNDWIYHQVIYEFW